MSTHMVPRHLQSKNYVLDFGPLKFTFLRMGIVAVGVLFALTLVATKHLSPTIKFPGAGVCVVLTIIIGWVEPYGRAPWTWVLLAFKHFTSDRTFVYRQVQPDAVGAAPSDGESDGDTLAVAPALRAAMAPENGQNATASTKAKGRAARKERAAKAPPSRYRPTQGLPFMPREIANSIVEMPDGGLSAGFEIQGLPLSFMARVDVDDVEEQFKQMLRAIPFPTQYMVHARYADTWGHVSGRLRRLRDLPEEVNGFSMERLRQLEYEDVNFVESEARRVGAIDLAMYVVVPLEAPAAASALRGDARKRRLRELEDRCATMWTALRGMELSPRRLDTGGLFALYQAATDPRAAQMQPIQKHHRARALVGITSFKGKKGTA